MFLFHVFFIFKETAGKMLRLSQAESSDFPQTQQEGMVERAKASQIWPGNQKNVFCEQPLFILFP